MVEVIVVNERDEEVLIADTLECHQGQGRLHRAFTVLLFNNNNQLLIQQRSENKLLWPLFWESSCSGHPLPGEDYLSAGERRLKEELGISCKLTLRAKFQYHAKYRDVGSENEICALLVGKYDGIVQPNVEEVNLLKLIELGELNNQISINPNTYAPWLMYALKYYDCPGGHGYFPGP